MANTRLCPKCGLYPPNPWRLKPAFCLICLRALNVAEGGVKTDADGTILNPSVAPYRRPQ